MQAQTVANFFLAFEQDLAIVPVLNKVDLPAAEPQRVAEQMQQVWPAMAALTCIPLQTGLPVGGSLFFACGYVQPDCDRHS